MQIINIQTLIDVTNTNVRRINQGTQLQLDQFRNWTTMMQTIGMRAIIDYDHDPKCESVDVTGLGFGSEFKGVHKVWTFQFRSDRPDAFSADGDPIKLLINDLDKVPVITNLSETINIKQAVFELINASFKNTVVKAI